MVKKLSKARSRVSTVTKRRRKPAEWDEKNLDEEERILRQATMHLIRKEGGLFVATALRETHIKEIRVWIITVTLRYPTGHEGYVGDLLFDGENFTMLTEQSMIDERVRQIAADPKGIQEWNEYRASVVQ